jgi:hypothetical protein
METDIKKPIWNIRRYINLLDDRLFANIAELRELVSYYGKKLDICEKVEDHFYEADEGCPVTRYCYLCKKYETCTFSKTYSGNLSPETAQELHIMLYHKWRTLILLIELYEVIKQIDLRMCEVEERIAED